MTIAGTLHANLIFDRRVRVLASALADLLGDDVADVLDVGCGDGRISRQISTYRPDVRISGVDVLVRPQTHIPVSVFNGSVLPCADQSVDAILFVDVLHHTDDPWVLLREARRVARRAILIKDHCADNLGDHVTLRIMDWVGNAHHGVRLPCNYWSRAEWTLAFRALGLHLDSCATDLPLYPFPASLFFQRDLHFVARLVPTMLAQAGR